MRFDVNQPLNERVQRNRRVNENTRLHVNDGTPLEELVGLLARRRLFFPLLISSLCV